jgi:hypothetical protein
MRSWRRNRTYLVSSAGLRVLIEEVLGADRGPRAAIRRHCADAGPLPGPFPLTSSPLEFGASARLMQEAYEKTRAFLAAVEPDGPGLYGHPPMVPGIEDEEEMREVTR